MATKKLQILDSLNKNAVLYTPQELTEEEKSQARANLNIPSLDENGKIPTSQLPDDIGGGVPADHTHDISDIDGLLIEETYTELNTIWEYSDDITPDFSFNLGSDMQHLYKFSDSIDPNSLIGMSFETMAGDVADITSDMIDSSVGIYHAILVDGMGYILVFPADFDSSMMGMSGVVSAGSYASIYSTDAGDYGVSKVQGEIEVAKLSISTELLPAALQIGEVGTKIEWDGTPTSEFVNVDGLDFYKVSDAYIDAESLIGNTVSLCAIETDDIVTVNISSDSIIDLGENCFIISPAELDGMPPVIITSSAISRDGVEFPSAGIWFLTVPDVAYTSCLESVQIKKLDPKFIPNYFYETGFYTDCDASKATAAVIVPANEELDTPEFRYLKFAEPIDASIQGYLLGMTFDGTTEEIAMGDGDGALITSGTGSEYGMYALNIKTDNETVNLEDFGIPIFTVVEAGLYIFDVSAVDDSVKFSYFKAPDYKITKIDKRFIPDVFVKSETIGQPNGVATLDEAGKVPLAQLPEIDAGIKSWNDLEDKPFYEAGWSIEWDGTPTNEHLDMSDTMGAILYKVGESKTKEELIGVTCRFNLIEDDSASEMEYTISQSDIVDTDSENCFIVFYNGSLGIFASVLEDGEYHFSGITFNLTKGTWFVKASNYTPIYLGNKEIIKIDEKFLPEGFGSGEGCPTYSGGMVSNSDLDNLFVINWYKLLGSLTTDYKFDANQALYNINSNQFILDFRTNTNISCEDPDKIILKIATGYTGSLDDFETGALTSDIHVELGDGELKQGTWYTVYCIYNESMGAWSGTLISAAADTSDLENQINNLESRISSIQSQVWEKQDTSNLVTSIDSVSKDYQYPSAKLLYDTKIGLETQINDAKINLENTKQDKNLVTSIDENSTDEQYPSAKLLYDIIGDCNVVLDEISALIGE